LADGKPFLALVQVQAHSLDVILDALHVSKDRMPFLRGFAEGIRPERVKVSGMVRSGTECRLERFKRVMGCIIFGGQCFDASAVVMDERECHGVVCGVVVFSFVLVRLVYDH
jgi:hypothetical protein